MSITINIYYTGTEEDVNGFANEMIESGIVDKIRSQKGNEKYLYFKPIESTGTLLLIDQWSSQQALDIHHASPMMEDIINLRDKYKLAMKVERYTSANDAITDNDRKYIS